MNAKVNGFTLNYPDLNNKHVDYRRYQILRELEFIPSGFICISWGKTMKRGTQAIYSKATPEEIEEKLKELKEELKNYVRS